MGKVTKKEMPLWAKTGHKAPVTRREFLAAGIIPFAASAFVPGALGLLSAPSTAHAAECTEPPSGLAAFVTLNLSGGAALMANLLPRDQAFNPLPNYASLGYPTMPTMVTEYGSPSWSSSSGLLAGLNAVITDTAVRNKVQVIQISVASVDDSGSNRFDASGMVYAAGLRGTLMPNLGRRSTSTGINQLAAQMPPPQPLIVNSVNDIVNALGYTAALNNGGLSANQKQKLATLVGNLSAAQSRKLASISSVAHVKDLVECAGVKNATVVGAAANLVNPFANGASAQAQQVATIWNANGNPQNSNQIFGSMVYNGLLSQAGSVNLELGGYDYHDGTRTTGDTRDNEAGVQIGKIIMSANTLGKKVAIYLTSDGSVSVGGNGTSWVADRGQAGSAILFLFDPAGRPELNGPPQIGHYNSSGNSQVVAPTLVADPQTAALAAFRNYIAFNGASAMPKFEQVFARGVLSPAQLDTITKVVPK